MAFAHKFTLVLSEKVPVPGTGGKKKVHKQVGKAEIPCPTLADFGIQAKQSVYSAEDVAANLAKPEAERVPGIELGKLAFENGMPIYEDVRFDWLQTAIVTSVQIKVRNKFSKGVLKPGMQIPEDFDMLTAETARSGDALVMRREARADFEQFLRSLNKKDGVVTKLSELFWNSKTVLGVSSPEYIKAMEVYTQRWTEQLDATKAARFQPKIAELEESINATKDIDDDDLMAEGEVTAKAA